VEQARGFSGWSAYPRSRRLGPAPPWSYDGRARDLLSTARSVVDLGTGGGERFGDYCTGYQGRAVATEEWMVNAPVAAARLRPLGVDVVRCQSLRLPFADESFDLLLDRHEELAPHEVARVLTPGGRVLTQQVSPGHWLELLPFFPRANVGVGDLFGEYRDGFAAAGLEIADARTHTVDAAYSSLEDFVHMLCITPWTVPGFDPLGRDLEALLALERDLATEDGLVLTDARFLIEARKPL
jgi:SAM-dependent methyltransferase